MRDIKNLNIWKQEPDLKGDHEAFLDADITELNLGVRSYNCLKRAGCNTIRDIFQCMDEDGQGLRKIRNLGTRSENEIMAKIKELEEIYGKTHPAGSAPVKRTIIKPAKKIWNMEKNTRCEIKGENILCFRTSKRVRKNRCGNVRYVEEYLRIRNRVITVR